MAGFRAERDRRVAKYLQPVRSLPKMTGNIERNKDLEKVWKSILTEPSVAYSDPNRWRAAPDVRPSSFPFCPRAHVLKKLGAPMPDSGDVRMNFYTSVGIALHEVVQNAFGRKGHLWGFWQCARPGCGAYWRQMKKPSYSPMLRGKKCKNCGSEFFNYHELRLTDEDIGLAMHTDGILPGDDYSAVLEVKTTDEKKVRFLKQCTKKELDDLFHTTSPWFGYLHQATTYAVHAKYRYPKFLANLDRIKFLILSRNQPNDYVSVTAKVPDDMLWQNIRSSIVMAQWAAKKKVLPRGIASSEKKQKIEAACKWCDFKDICLKKNGDEHVDVKADALFSKKARRKLKEIKEKAREDFVPRKH